MKENLKQCEYFHCERQYVIKCMPPIWKPKGIVLSNRLMVNKTKTLHNIERCQIERINI